ncbi:hypothetical protein B7P43_G08882 [Cryptotermes secundus]|uniref:Helicase domino n=2 Tax=Cryptotermes secundus TaxID=105785 RepID=A0A2J7R7S2_9NEOP|nr:hypothetical protein B7P43_G08882 [Cryptotermes secundus]
MSDHQAGAGPQQPPQTLNVAGQAVRLQQVLAAAGSRGQQFVITSQVSVPGLTQVIPTIATTSAALQQAGVTRILNIASSPRVNVVGVSQVPGRGGTLQLAASNAGNSGTGDSPGRGTVSLVAIGQPAAVNASSHPTLVSSLSSPPRQRTTSGAIGIVQSPPTLVLTSTPNLVRTSNGSFTTPLSSAANIVSSPQSSSPVRKRMRLSELQERAPPNEEIGTLRKRVLEYKTVRMHGDRERYAEHASELFFLQAGGNMMDYHTWRKRPSTPQFLHFLRSHRLDPEDDDEDLTSLLCAASTSGSSQSSHSTELKIPGVGSTPVAISTTLPPTVAQLNQHGGTPLILEPGTPTNLNSVTSGMGSTPGLSIVNEKGSVPVLSPSKLNKLPLVAPMSRQHTRQHSISAVYDTSIGSQEQIAEKAKQEAYVMQRITELQREGLWSEKRLPKVQEPPRVKAHWDYLIEEMIWLAADFAQERKWKKAAAKKCARNVQKYFQEKAIQAQKAEKVQELRLKKIASFISKEIKTFWSNVEKLVEYKQQTRLEEKRKKALDQHLSFIVDQTEKYSTWLAESMNKSGVDSVNPSVPASVNSSRISSPVRQVLSDDEFQPSQSSTDDEETIAKAEEDLGVSGHIEEVEMLNRESKLPLEDLLKELPDDYLENRDKAFSSERSEVGDDISSRGDDDEFTVATDKESTDDEETIQEQEAAEGDVDHKKELEELQAENEISVEDLIAKYGCGGSAEDVEEDLEESEAEEVEDEISGNESDNESENSTEDDAESVQSKEVDIGLKSLLDDDNQNGDEMSIEKKVKDNEAAGKGISDVAALAESIQPKGNTLSSTSVVTTVPFLLKHTLREYQHIGLDWLVTMFDRKLNGILADEMGLGKTIQTISLLAHLACEKGNWGPHLIIVPTSVMLNWEMELKKWCPAFKILTYYGSQKERKQKRTGWTKPNAFHVCITSYKLVIQDHQSFRRKKWKYLILDEAQNIKNFKSQRWQLLLNFQTQRRLLLTGTPLQNNLMELWSLMHFLMPNVFQSHREFKEWFSNPVTGMIEGNSEYNESLIKRLHKVLRPFLLRRLKTEVEKQLPKKYEHIVMCRLSKRQRYLYDDFMSRAKTRETLATGNLLSVINVLMQLRKVCNHPNLFEVRPTISPFQTEGITYVTASLVMSVLDYDPFKHVDLFSLNLLLVELETCLTAFVAHRIKKYRTPKKLIEEIDSMPGPPPRCPSGKIKIHVRLSSGQQQQHNVGTSGSTAVNKGYPLNVASARVGTSPLIRAPTGQGVTLRVTGGSQRQGYSVQLVQHQGGVKAIPVATLGPTPQQQTLTGVQVKQSDGVQRFSVPAGFAQLVQTSTGRHILLTPSTQVIQPLSQNPGTTTVMTASGHRLTVLSKSVSGVATTTVTTVNRMISSGQTTPTSVARPVMRVPPVNMSLGAQTTLGTLVNTVVAGTMTVTTTTTVTSTKTCTAVTQPVLAALVQQSQRNNTMHTYSPSASSSIVTRNETKIAEQQKRKQELQAETHSVFYLPELEVKKQLRRKAKLEMLNRFNMRRCAACPIYGSDLIEAMRIVDMVDPHPGDFRGAGYVHCLNALKETGHRPDGFWTQTEHLMSLVHTPQRYVNELRDIFSRFVLCVPAVSAPQTRFHVSHPPPSKFWGIKRTQAMLQQELSSRSALLHPIASAMVTQFPDPRLIQYDCGKLQVLDRLLRQLKADHHRVLIFTQMTRMLDVLEAFLNFHGHIYLRLDGTTRIDQRQMLMERFNADRRIFCFILSTRSGGIGVNLTGADTVIFYDSDWNPTMDAQAQDRCHRIGQTRDVHIYRLVSEMTVEENILKKANQKRLLGDLAIEGGNFTTAYFKSSTIQDLFNIDIAENDASRRMAEVLDRDNEKEQRRQKDDAQQLPLSPNEDKVALGALETALAAAEDESDVQAARTAKAEAAADLAEFDETIPLEDGETGGEQEMSKAELEVHNLIQQLTPVERYAMKFVEDTEAVWSAEQLAAAEAEIEQQKREWELGRLQVLKEEADRRTRVTDDDEQLLTFSHEDAHNQVNNSTGPSNSDESKRSVVGGSRRSRGGSRGRGGRGRGRSRNYSGAQNFSASDGDTSSCNDVNAASSVDEEEEESDEKDSTGDESYIGSRYCRNSGNRKPPIPNNHRLISPNSPRTRSSGTVSINLWTLDVSPILPGLKPVGTSAQSQASILRGGRGGRMRRGSGRGLQNFMRSPDGQSVSPRRLSSSSGHSVRHNSPPSTPYSNPNLVIRTRRALATPVQHSDGSEIDMSESLCPKRGGRMGRVTRRSENIVEGNGPIS